MINRRRVGVLVACFVAFAAAADVRDMTVSALAREGQVLVSFELPDGVTADVRDAIQSGLATTFSYELELRRESSWFDRTVAAISVSATVRFDNLTRRYQLSRSVDGRLEDARPTEDLNAVGVWLTHFERIAVAPTTALEANGEYFVRVRARTRPRNAWFFWPWSGTVLGNARFTFIQ